MDRVPAPTTRDHHEHVLLQRRVHETRRLLLEAADHLLDLDHAVRGSDPDRAAVARRRAASVTATAQQKIDVLDLDARDTTPV